MPEAVEVQAINVLAPFLLNSKLKPLLLKSGRDTYIVNVSAMEGQFYRYGCTSTAKAVGLNMGLGGSGRKHKTTCHPHTNMAKAALNMMTRTSAPAYAMEKIYMSSVDTGWYVCNNVLEGTALIAYALSRINDENPAHMALQNEKRGFRAPLDEVDAAMRVLDPILHGINTGQAIFGAFLKDYRPCPW